jgi:lysine 6-dehydrogenase
MEIIVLGCGHIGSVVAADLAQSLPSAEIVIADRSLSRARETASATRRENVAGAQLDARSRFELVSALKKCDLVVGALPGDIGYYSVKAAIAAGVNMVDVSYMPENPLQLSKEAEKAGVTVVPDCGVAPGISNVLIGHSLGRLDEVESIYVMVGGLPEKPVPPLGYTITWSAEGLIDEYTRKAKIVKDGRVVSVSVLTGLEVVDFPGVGRLEAFYTDGLRTLIHTVKNARTMWEKTLRYPGHVEKINLLKALGFFDKKPVKVEDISLPPRKLTSRLLEAKLRRPNIKDVLALKVEVCGKRRNDETHYIYYLLDHCEQKHGVSAMARTTAYPASILAQLVARGEIKTKGVVPLETLSVEEKLFKRIMDELEKRQIKIVSQCPS